VTSSARDVSAAPSRDEARPGSRARGARFVSRVDATDSSAARDQRSSTGSQSADLVDVHTGQRTPALPTAGATVVSVPVRPSLAVLGTGFWYTFQVLVLLPAHEVLVLLLVLEPWVLVSSYVNYWYLYWYLNHRH